MKKKLTYNIQSPVEGFSVEQLFNNAMHQHQRGNLEQAEQLYRKVLQMQPKHAYALNLLGVLISQHKKDHQEAEKLIAKAIKIDPGVPDYHNNLGLALQQQGKMEEAAKSFRKATHINPEFTPAWFSVGNVSVYLNDAQAAIEAYQKVIKNEPGFLPAWNNLGNVYREIGRFADAHEMFNKVIELKPDFAEAWYNIGVLYKVKEEGENAIAAFDKAIALKHDYLRAYTKRGNCRSQLLNDVEGALQDFDHVLELDPRYVPSYIFKASAFREQGRFDEAENELRRALDIDESSLDAFLGLVRGKKYNERDLDKLQDILDDPDLDTNQLQAIHFTLGKIFDDRKDYEKAFRHLQKGNELHRSTYEFDINQTEQIISRFIAVVDAACIRQTAIHGLDSEVPVFIVGMPRSGTTLTEQIISSHPDAFGAGELKFIGNLVMELSSREIGKYPEFMPHFPADEIKKLASAYLAHISKLNGNASRITDKMPGNFLHVGFIASLFPRASIIHCKRNPLDTCLSVYEQNFQGLHPYADDLVELGLYYRQYLRLMAHWESVLPGRMLTLHYEDLLRDQEGMSRRLIEHIGLPWDARCLQFHETERSVKTSSQWQVRQQLYTTSRERWRHYEPWLKPLIEALGDTVDK